MDIALGFLRSVLLGALGGLSAFALATWMGWAAAPVGARPGAPAAGVVLPVLGPAARLNRVTAPVPASDTARRFIAETAGASLYDAHAARLVQGRSADAAVQALAGSVLRDHEAAWPVLNTLARSCGVALPEAPTPEQRQTLSVLRDVAEHTRGHLFVRHVGLESARAEIARYEAALQALDDADAPLRDWIEQTLPALRERAALSQQLLPRVAERRPMA